MFQPSAAQPTALRPVSEGTSAPCGVVLVAHAPLASAMLSAAQNIVEAATGDIVAVDIDPNTPAEQIGDAIAAVNGNGSVLVMADLFGGTAANLALAQLGDEGVDVVTGLNLAMLLDVLLKRDQGLPVTELAERAAQAAQKSVVVASELLGARAA